MKFSQRSKYSLAESNLQQNCLKSDISLVNLSICELNLEHNVSNIRLDKDLQNGKIHAKEGINYPLEESNLQQKCLEFEIREVNLSICELNFEHNASYIRLDKDLQNAKFHAKRGYTWGKKQVKFVYDNFTMDFIKIAILLINGILKYVPQ